MKRVIGHHRLKVKSTHDDEPTVEVAAALFQNCWKSLRMAVFSTLLSAMVGQGGRCEVTIDPGQHSMTRASRRWEEWVLGGGDTVDAAERLLATFASSRLQFWIEGVVPTSLSRALACCLRRLVQP